MYSLSHPSLAYKFVDNVFQDLIRSKPILIDYAYHLIESIQVA